VKPIGILNAFEVNDDADDVAALGLAGLDVGDDAGVESAGELGELPTPLLVGAKAYNTPPTRRTSTVAATAIRA